MISFLDSPPAGQICQTAAIRRSGNRAANSGDAAGTLACASEPCTGQGLICASSDSCSRRAVKDATAGDVRAYDDIGGAAHLTKLVQQIPNAAHVKFYRTRCQRYANERDGARQVLAAGFSMLS